MLNRNRVILVVMDGLGLSQIPNDDSNAFRLATKPHLDHIWKNYPMCIMHCSGRAVGLPEGQMGNSEVGHQNLGAGRVVYQDITRIDLAIEKGEFGKNPTLRQTFDYVQKNGATLHLIGLVSDGGVHSSLDHLEALIREARQQGIKKVSIHALMDGRDTPPHSGINFIKQLQKFCSEIKTGRIATVTGRYYAMDRDNRWERVEKAYAALVRGEGHRFEYPVQAMKASYDRNVTDEFVEPSVISENGHPVSLIQDRDAVIFFNFRADRAREITRALTESGFSRFQTESLKLHYATMTQYQQDFDFPVLFEPLSLHNILGEIVADARLKQLRIAETEKYAHVTFFFNGGEERVFEGEDRIMVPSPRVATYDLQPEMSQPEVTRQVVEALKTEQHNLIVLNFANCDMVGHSGILPAAVKAVEAVDDGVGQVLQAAFEHGYAMILTADHGNCEMMVDPRDGEPHTAHTTNPVPCFILDRDIRVTPKPEGRLSDVAPTILKILNMNKPSEMEGVSLIAGTD